MLGRTPTESESFIMDITLTIPLGTLTTLRMRCKNEKTQSQQPCNGVLEVPISWLAENGILQCPLCGQQLGAMQDPPLVRLAESMQKLVKHYVKIADYEFVIREPIKDS